MMEVLARMIEEQQAALRNALADSMRRRLVLQTQLLRAQLESVAARRDSLQRQLDALCRDRRDGWIGLTLRSIRTMHVGRADAAPSATRLAKSYPVVESVDPGSPADMAGIRRGDTVLAIAGIDLSASPSLPPHLLRPGAVTMVKIRRSGRTFTLPVEVGQRPDFPSLALLTCPWMDATLAAAVATEVPLWVLNVDSSGAIFSLRGRVDTVLPSLGLSRWPTVIRIPRSDTAWDKSRTEILAWRSAPLVRTTVSQAVAGLELVPMNSELAEFFGSDEGLLVVRVLPGTPAHEVGFRAGDVILEGGGVRLTTPRQLANLLTRASGRQVELVLLRKRERKTLTLRW
jgi:hypothetical protein